MSSAHSALIPAIAPWLQLCRVSNLPTVWMNAVAAFLLCQAPFSPLKLSMLLFAFTATYCGGMVMNDCVDSSIDALQRPSRPLPAGKVGLREASFAYHSLFLASAVAYWAAGSVASFSAGVLLLGLVALYNLTHNRSVLSVVPMAGCRFMIYIVTGLAFGVGLPLPLLGLACLQFLYIVTLTVWSRLEKSKLVNSSGLPVVPVLLAGIPVVDGVALGIFLEAWWVGVGVLSGVAVFSLQRVIRGD